MADHNHYNPGRKAVTREQIGMVRPTKDKFGGKPPKESAAAEANEPKQESNLMERAGYKNGGKVSKCC